MTATTVLIARLTGERDSMLVVDRLRLFAHDPGTFTFDAGDADELVEVIDEAADALTAQEAELAKRIDEPPLTCPAIDAFVVKHAPDADVVKELSDIREINSNLRYSMWHWKTFSEDFEGQLEAAEAELARLREVLVDIELDITLADGISRGYDLKPALAKLRELLPCPFCGSSDIQTDSQTDLVKRWNSRRAPLTHREPE